MAQIASELLVERLADWGVDTVFGLPGDGINGIMEGLRRHQDRVKFVLVHHEEAAAFMATAYAKATGKLGVCLATSGPGAIHLLNGLYDAKLDHMPVLAITGMQETSVLGTGYQQEVHTDKLFMDVAEYNLVVDNPAQLPGVVDIAIRTALARRGVAHLSFPNDVQVADAAVLNGGEKVAILAGAGALHARDEVLATADRLGAPVIKTLSGKAVIPDDSEFAVGGIGLLGTRPGENLVEDCDTLFMIGTNFPYTQHLPQPGKVKVVQIEADPTRAGLRMPTEVPVIGDAKESLQALIPLLTPKSDRGHLEKYQKDMAKWRSEMEDLENPKRSPIAPQYPMAVIDDLAADDAILTW